MTATPCSSESTSTCTCMPQIPATRAISPYVASIDR